MDPTEELLTRGVANIIPGEKKLREALNSGKSLNIYLGIDPTATHIHLGHAVPLRKLQQFADLGHHVTFLIGDFTALIGDTSDKDTERPVLTPEQIKENFQTYKKQAEKLLDFSKVTVKYNSEWLSKLDFRKVLKLCREFSLNDFISRELIRKRLDAKTNIGLHEVLYPVMQGYDSYTLDTDIQLGGTDQTFNMQAGRLLLKRWRNKESFVMSNVFLDGTDGRKMSKSWGNAIWLDDKPEDMFAKVMAIHDEVIIQYFTLGTNIPQSEIKIIEKQLEEGENPMVLKKNLATIIVTELHSKDAAQKAQTHFEETVQKKNLPAEIVEVTLSDDDSEVVNEDLLVSLNLADSKSDAKRLFQQGGVSVNDGRVSLQDSLEVTDGMILKIGKRNIVKIRKP